MWGNIGTIVTIGAVIEKDHLIVRDTSLSVQIWEVFRSFASIVQEQQKTKDIKSRETQEENREQLLWVAKTLPGKICRYRINSPTVANLPPESGKFSRHLFA